MNNCYTNNCGTTYPASCVFYTNQQPLTGMSFTGIPNLDDILQLLSTKLDTLKNALDISSLDNNCFAFNPATDAQKIFFQELISKVCAIETEIGTLQTKVNDISGTVLNTVVTLDLKCLVPNPNPCGSIYTLGQALQLIINKICP